MKQQSSTMESGRFFLGAFIVALLIMVAGCAAPPVGADRVTTRIAYQQVEDNAISARRLSGYTTSLLHRHGLDQVADENENDAILQLHKIALRTGERDLLFALSELSYLEGDRLSRSVKAWEPRDARDYYLGAAVYSYLFLFGKADGDKPDAFDRRFRLACDLYNCGLGLALRDWRSTNAVAHLEGGRRKLPVGEMTLTFSSVNFPWSLDRVEEFLLADLFSVRGLSVRNREAGVGAPLIAVSHMDAKLRMRRSVPTTVFLRAEGSLADIAAGHGAGALELHSVYGKNTVTIGTNQVPLEVDLTVAGAHAMNQSFAWTMQRMQFFSLEKALPSQVIQSSPYEPGRVPVVFVHGTFSSPVCWTEMVNTLNADPVLRQRYQVWLYLYSSSKPLVISAAEFRDHLSALVQKLDPEGRDAALQQMVVVGHSQGGLMTKMTATDSGDQLWRIFSDKPLEELNASKEDDAEIRRLMFLKPLPFVRRTVFISTPHRGSYRNSNLVQKLGNWLISLPNKMVTRATDFLSRVEGIKVPEQMKKGKITSLDGMSVNNPLMLKLSDIPTAPGITSHSIISVKGDGDYHEGVDGVVAYPSAHVDYVESEFIVRSGHSCQSNPATIEEVRRILREHLASIPASLTNQTAPAPSHSKP